MRWLRGILFILFSGFCALGQARTTIADLERTLSQAPSLQDFLESSELRQIYFLQLKDYFGGEFPREPYEKILDQLSGFQNHFPEIENRLWETQPVESELQIDLQLASRGLDLNERAWATHLAHLEKSLSLLAGTFRGQEMKPHFSSLVASLELAEKRLNALPSKERRAQGQGLYEQLLSETPQFRKTLAWIARELLVQGDSYDLLLSKDADLVLEIWDRLRRAGGFSVDGVEVPEKLVRWAVKLHLPALETPPLALEKGRPLTRGFFTVATRQGQNGRIVVGAAKAGKIELKSLPRRFHGLWKGIPLKECVGGSCKRLDILTPRRWASVALEGARLYHVERNGSYHGFIQTVPFQLGASVYDSIEFGSALLLTKTLASDQKTKTRILDLVLEELAQRKPEGRKGFVVGQSLAINNSGVIKDLHLSYRYQIAAVGAGVATLSSLVDSQAEKMVNAFESFERAHGLGRSGYSETFILDPLVEGAGFLRMIAPVKMPFDPVQLAQAIVLNHKKLQELPETPLSERGRSLLGDMLQREVPEGVAVQVLLSAVFESDQKVNPVVIEALLQNYLSNEVARKTLLDLSLRGLVPAAVLEKAAGRLVAPRGSTNFIGFGLVDDAPSGPRPAEKQGEFETYFLKVWRQLPPAPRAFWVRLFVNETKGVRAKEWVLVESLRLQSLDRVGIDFLRTEAERFQQFDALLYLEPSDLERLRRAGLIATGGVPDDALARTLEILQWRLQARQEDRQKYRSLRFDSSRTAPSCSQVFAP